MDGEVEESASQESETPIEPSPTSDSNLEPFGDTAARIVSQVSEEEATAEETLPEDEPQPPRQTNPSGTGLSTLPISKRPTPKPTPERPPQEEIDAAMDMLLHGVPPDDFDPVTLHFCIDELIALKRGAIEQKKYIDADRYAQLIKQSQKAADVSNFSIQCTHKLAYFQEKYADAQEKVEETVETWAKLFGEFEEMIDAKMQEMVDSQNQELDEFDRTRPEELPAKYKKHSVEYNALRAREGLLILNEDFVVANAVKTKADMLEADELTGQHIKLQDDLQRQRNAIVEKHSQQFNAFATWLNGKRAEMIRARNLDLEGPRRRLAHYARLVETIERRGLPPNPYYGFTANRVSRKESIKALRLAAQAPMERDPSRAKPRDRGPIPGFRPTTAIRLANSPPIKKPTPGH
jgi:hypothetical protein